MFGVQLIFKAMAAVDETPNGKGKEQKGGGYEKITLVRHPFIHPSRYIKKKSVYVEST